MKRAVTTTIVFEADALNRDEKIGGNILSIKKITRGWGETYSFISRPAIRHYLFVTLYRMNPNRWRPAPVTKAKGTEKDVVQFDLEKGGIEEYAELDIFGYMETEGKGSKSETEKGSARTRKAPLGITKAISLEPWSGDMAFYANHDLASRFKKQNPDATLTPSPYNTEEHRSLYKLSFTLDCEKVGVEENGSEISLNEKRDRISDVLMAIHNGLYYHSSGECLGIVPLVLVAGILRVPVPIFHSIVEVNFDRESKNSRFRLKEAPLLSTICNGWLDEEDGVKLFYIESSDPDFVTQDLILKSCSRTWSDFVGKVFE